MLLNRRGLAYRCSVSVTAGDQTTRLGTFPRFRPCRIRALDARGLTDPQLRRSPLDAICWVEIADNRGVCGPKSRPCATELDVLLYVLRCGDLRSFEALIMFYRSFYPGSRLPRSILCASPLEGSISMRSLTVLQLACMYTHICIYC